MTFHRDEATGDISTNYKPLDFATDVCPSFSPALFLSLNSNLGSSALKSQTYMG